MKILLVTPLNRSYVIMPSLGLGYLASVSRIKGHNVDIIDCMKERMSIEDFGHFIKNNLYDVIGLQVFSYDLPSLKKYLSLIKRNNPDTITVAGGAHPSGDPFGILDFLPELDYAFKGEAEIGFPIFLDKITQKKSDFSDVPGLIYRRDGEIIVNPPKVIDDLDTIPMPAWDIIKPETYPEAPHGAFTKQFPTAPIIITRGCPFSCTFCAGKSITGHKVRARSIDNVMEELRYLHKRGIREFHIEDENFTANRSLVIEFCERILKEGLNMSWSLPAGVRIDTLQRDMLELMDRAGCYSMALGIEFGSQRVMDMTKKRLTIEMVKEKLRLFEGLNIKKTGFFLFAIPGETIEEIEDTIRFALELPIDRAQFNNFMPLPGSELWNKLKKEGRLGNINWDRFFVHDVAYVDKGINPSDIKRLQRKAYIKFYLRPRIIFGLVREVRSLRHLKFLLIRFIDALK